MTNEELLQRHMDGDASALEQLYEQNIGLIKLYNQPTTTFTPLETVQTGACTYKIFVYKSADISYNESAML